MGWLTSHTSANKIVISEREDKEPASIAAAGGVTGWDRTVTTTMYKYVGMTEAATDTALAALNDPANGVYAVKKREGAGGNYMLEVTTVTYGAWGAV
jgi:hypothetical protein|tara:strand:+ start:682 stop:972 length:291 start_codon:yes stop_codon:yes gene_type:complete